MSTAILPYTGCDCCSCVAPRLLTRTSSAGGSKKGFRPYVSVGGLLSTQFYLTASQSGSLVGYTPGGVGDCTSDFTDTRTAGGSMATDRYTGEITGEMTCGIAGAYSDPCGGTDYSSTGSTTEFNNICAFGTVVFTSDTYTVPGYSGALTLTMGGEFTDAMLFEDHPVPAFEESDEFAEALPYGLFVFNGTTLGRATSEYKFAFPVPGNGICYQVTWRVVTEALTPAGLRDYAVAHTYETMSFTWDGNVPDGYDAEDPTTWPTSPTYTIPIPDFNASVKVVVIGAPTLEDPEAVVTGGITYSCERCA